MGLIYKIANDINNKVYIGQTIKTLETRINWHLRDSKNKRTNCLIHKAIRKYGWKHFTVEILEDNILLENLNERELYYTNKFNALAPGGYVLIAGGEPRIVSDDTRQKMSTKRMGYKCSEKTKKKMSLSKLGKNHPMYGKHHTQETINKIFKNHSKRKSVLCFDLYMNFIKEYESIREAERELNLNNANIVLVCQGKRNKVGNYKFKYK